MAFEPVQTQIPTSLGDIEHIITDYVDDVPTMTYSIQVLDQDGFVMRVLTGDEVPHLTQAQIDGLLAFAAVQRGKAESCIPI